VELGELSFVADGTVAGDDDGAVGDGGEVLRGSGDHSVDVASARVVDEGVEAVPPGIAAMEDVSFGEVDGEVGIGVGGLVVGELESVFVVGEGAVAVEEDGGQRAGGSGRDDGLVGDDVLSGAHAVAGVLVSPDGGSSGVHPLVAVGVVEVPVGVDEDLDRVGVDGGQGGGELGLAGSVAGVDEELALFGGEDGDVAASSLKSGDVAAKRSGGDLVIRVGSTGSGEEVLGLLGEQLLRDETGCGGGGCAGSEEPAAGDGE